MLSYNVAGLLRKAPGSVARFGVEGETLDLAEDLRLAAPIEGQITLARTGRSILARAELRTALEEGCSRCLALTASPVEIRLEEEALPSIDLVTGLPVDRSAEPDALRLDEHHELDLSEPVREAISLAEPIAPLCRPDCRGLCPECGADLNIAPQHAHAEDEIDPRLARLAEWRALGKAQQDQRRD